MAIILTIVVDFAFAFLEEFLAWLWIAWGKGGKWDTPLGQVPMGTSQVSMGTPKISVRTVQFPVRTLEFSIGTFQFSVRTIQLTMRTTPIRVVQFSVRAGQFSVRTDHIPVGTCHLPVRRRPVRGQRRAHTYSSPGLGVWRAETRPLVVLSGSSAISLNTPTRDSKLGPQLSR